MAESGASGRQEVLVLLATRAMTLALTVVDQSLLAYALGPEGRGAYAVCVVFGVLAAMLVTPGSARGTQYFVMARRISLSQGMSIGLAICLVGSAIAIPVALVLIRSDLPFFGNADAGSFHWALLLMFCWAASVVTQLQLSGLRRFVRLAVFAFVQKITLVGGIAALVWWLRLGVDGAIIALSLGHIAMIAVGVADLWRHCGLRPEWPSPTALRWALGYGVKGYAARVGLFLDQRAGVLLLGVVSGSFLGALGGRGDIGLYAAANGIVMIFLYIAHSVSTYLLPRIAGQEDGRPELAARCARITLWGTAGALLLWFAVSPFVVPLLLSAAFAPVVRLTWIMSIGVCAYAAGEVFFTYFLGTNRPQVCSWALALGLSVNVGLFFTLYPAMGLAGVAWALTGGLLCRSVFLWAMFRRASGTPIAAALLLGPGDAVFLWGVGRSLLRRRA